MNHSIQPPVFNDPLRMSDAELFAAAQGYAQRRQQLLALAADAHALGLAGKTRRQVLLAARRCEAKVLDLSISAELRCMRDAERNAA